MTTLKIADIVTDAGTQVRSCLDNETVSQYAEAMAADISNFPFIDVFHDGSRYILADGFHRLMAANQNGWTDIKAIVHKGTRADALKFALSANSKHGLKRTNADKRRSVVLAIQEWPAFSDAEVSGICAVGRQFVLSVRQELHLTCHPITGSERSEEKRLGADGKWRRMPVRTTLKRRPFTQEEESLLRAHGPNESIYIIQDSNLVKIGWTRHPSQRVEKVLTEFPSASLVALASAKMADEKEIHSRIECERERGEWFKISADDAIKAVEDFGLKVNRISSEPPRVQTADEKWKEALPGVTAASFEIVWSEKTARAEIVEWARHQAKGRTPEELLKLHKIGNEVAMYFRIEAAKQTESQSQAA